MWKRFLEILLFSVFFNGVFCKIRQNLIQLALEQNLISTKNYVFWPNATVPFYVNSEHFDHEQSLSILTALSMFAFKTCIKFAPVMAAPSSNEHVMVFENANGVRRCVLDTMGHSVFEPHMVTLGYDCLQSPQIDMMIMRSLGFPFEHNRANRDIYLDVLNENIEQGNTDLFTKEATQPSELRAIPYDINSVMHFGPRDFSKNGHRTILFKDHNVQQNRVGLTNMDLKKIEIVYGPECRTRDRQEKIDLCQSYPGVARKKRDINSHSTSKTQSRKKRAIDLSTPQRRKRDVEATPERRKRDVEVTKSLRVNPEITPPANETNVKDTLAELGIENEVQEIVDKVFKTSALALSNAREKYCHNNTKPNLRAKENVSEKQNSDILGIIEVVAHFAQDMVDSAVANLTKFCEESESIGMYQRARCSFNDGSERCRQTYRSTKSGPVKYRTQHRPVYIQSTKHRLLGHGKKIYDPMFRSGNDTNPESSRKKRDVNEAVDKTVGNEKDKSDDTKQEKKEVEQKTEENQEIHKKTALNEEVEQKTDANQEVHTEKTTLNGSLLLRSGTGMPGMKRNRYEPIRRHGKRNRNKHGEVIDDSSLSTETKKPIKKKHHRQSDTEDRQDKQSENVDRNRLRDSYNDENSDRESQKKRKPQSSDIEDTTDRRDEQNYEDRESQKKRKPQSSDTEDTTDRRDERNYENSQRETYKKRKHRQSTEPDEAPVTRKMKKEKPREVEDEPEEEEEQEVTTERHKKKKKPDQRSESLPRVVKLSKENEEFYKDRKWPGGLVHYIIQEDTTYDTNDLRKRLAAVDNILRRKTCVRLKEISHDQANKYEDYVVIDNSPDYVTGRVGGRQKFGSIELFRGDQHRQHTAMMVMAMLGFYFEVSRHDRDKYVRVHMRHVRPDKLHHFEKIRKDATLPLPYDFQSATHPAWQYWRQLGRTGISSVATYKHMDPEGTVMKSMGQNSKLLSDIDIVKINSVYGIKCQQNERSKGKEDEPKQKRRPKGNIKIETSS